MRIINILTVVMLVVCGILFYALAIGFEAFEGQGIYNKIKIDQQIKDSEAKVIEQLKHIRSVQKAYYTNNKKYAPTWESLFAFMDSGKIYEIQKREVIIAAEKVRPKHELYKGDSVRFEYDTLGSAGVVEKLFPKSQYPDFDPKKINQVPGNRGEFILKTDTVEKGKLQVSVVEVVNPFPVNPQRKESNENPKMRFLRFGSLTEVSTAGNWED